VRGNANLTRLTILKSGLVTPGGCLRSPSGWRVGPFRARAKPGFEAAALFRQARALLARVNPYAPKVDRKLAKVLHDCLQTFQNEYKTSNGGPVRIIHNWDLLLVEAGAGHLSLVLRLARTRLQTGGDYCQHYDSRCGNGLNGPSRTKIEEMARFVYKLEEVQGNRQ